ncbi:hypothetical protein [Paenibacillus alginolyticus]|nr:hypothetical protein [Paenibacillus alginolyticus]MEC0143660.1 hypothetical protein [Paenibacillus alginolyticus]
MKKIICLAHDPGGYDVTKPLVTRLNRDANLCEFYCLGPAAGIDKEHASTEEILFSGLEADELPGVCVTGTSWGSDLELRFIRECKERGIPTVSVLDFWSSYASRFELPSGQAVYPDHLVVMDNLAYDEAIEAGVPSNILRVLGHPGLDRWVSTPACNASNIGGEGTKLLFVSQPLSTIYGDTLGYTEYQVFADLLRAIQKDLGEELRIKFHPKESTQMHEAYSNYAIEGELSSLFADFDIVIGMSSMALLLASLSGKITLNYQPGLVSEDMAITNKLGLTKLIHSFDQLVVSLDDARNKLHSRSQQHHGISDVINNPLWFDGKSTERVVSFIRGLAGLCE